MIPKFFEEFTGFFRIAYIQRFDDETLSESKRILLFYTTMAMPYVDSQIR